MGRTALPVLVLVALTVAGCVTPSPGRQGSAWPQARCLPGPHEARATQSLIFFCIESP
jgi:hypothetical protein